MRLPSFPDLAALARRIQGGPPPEAGDGWVVVPSTPEQIAATARHCRRLVHRKALVAAGVAVLPVPGLDWLTDIGVLVKLLGEINTAFGLTPEQIERLTPERRIVTYKALAAGGSLVAGKLVSRELVMVLLRKVGVRLTVQQGAKYLPLAGQAVSAALTYSALRVVCLQHIAQCEAVAARLALPAPNTAATGSAVH